MSTDFTPRFVIKDEPDRTPSLLGMPLQSVIGLGLIFLLAALNLVNVLETKNHVGLDGQVLLKLSIVGLSGLYSFHGLLTDRRVRDVLLAFPGFWLVLIVFFYAMSCITALDPTFAVASTGVLAIVILMTVVACVQFGLERVLTAIFYGMAFFVVGSWFMYLFVPSIGIYDEPIGNGQFQTRMAGLAHPNTLGQFSGFTVVLGTLLFVHFRQRSWFRIAVILLAAAALVGSLSRTSLLAVIMALAFVFRHKLLDRRILVPMLAASAVGFATIVMMSTSFDFSDIFPGKLSKLTKSGDIAELTTATGRVDIWAATLRLIAESPTTGYGPASSKELLSEYSRYTHNLVLNVALSTGVFGGLAVILMIMNRVGIMLRKRNMVADGIVVFVIFNGLFENVMFSILAGMPTMVWVVGLTWWSYTGDPALSEAEYGEDSQPKGLQSVA